MTITTYFVTRKPGRSYAEADAVIHLVNDLAADNGDNRSWDATRADINALVDPDTQARLGIIIQAEQFELMDDD